MSFGNEREFIDFLQAKGKPPLLSDVSNPYTWLEGSANCFDDRARVYREGTEAQREADIKHYEGG